MGDTKINFLELNDTNYPDALRQLKDKVKRLYYVGNIDLIHRLEQNISIVGTRKASIYGKTTTQLLVNALSHYDTCIVSGMAYGIDSAAHQAAITTNLPTIAVLGCGLLETSVSTNPIYKSILAHGGLIVSEYEPNYPAQKHTFRDRNRIISALSFATVIVEAPAKSGALITADYSLELRRELYAVSGEINKTNIQGNINLLASGVAKPIFSVRAWAEGLKLNPRQQQTQETIASPVLERIGNEPISSDSLLSSTGLSSAELSAELAKLSARGYIRKIFGQRYIRV